MASTIIIDSGCTYAVVGDHYRFLATGDDTEGRYAFFEALVYPGGGPPPHVQSREDEAFFVSSVWHRDRDAALKRHAVTIQAP
jgi:hypothetical protein